MTSQSENPLLAAMGRQVGLFIVFSIVVLCLCVTCIMTFLFLASFPGSEGMVNLLNEYSMVTFLAIALGIPAVYILLLTLRNRNLNEHFLPLGLQQRKSILQWRKWEGIISGHKVTVIITGGPTFRIYRFIVHTPVNAHFGIEPRTRLGKALSRMVKHKPIELDYPELSGVVARSPDEQWLSTLFNDQPIRDAFVRLMSTAYRTEMRSILGSPDGVNLLIYFSRLSELTTENLQKWLDDLLIITAAAETLPLATEPIT
jgi:hypothetical protein